MTSGHTVPKEDPQNNCTLIMASESGGTTTLEFQRKVNTGDSNDLPIEVIIYINAFTPDSVKSKIDKFSEITNWMNLTNEQHLSKILLNSFPIKPLRPNNDVSQTSHCNIKGVSVSEVMRIESMITQVQFD